MRSVNRVGTEKEQAYQRKPFQARYIEPANPTQLIALRHDLSNHPLQSGIVVGLFKAGEDVDNMEDVVPDKRVLQLPEVRPDTDHLQLVVPLMLPMGQQSRDIAIDRWRVGVAQHR
jgi:hypothetical protein